MISTSHLVQKVFDCNLFLATKIKRSFEKGAEFELKCAIRSNLGLRSVCYGHCLILLDLFLEENVLLQPVTFFPRFRVDESDWL